MKFIPSAAGPEHGPGKALYFILDSRSIVTADGRIPEMTRSGADRFPMGRAFFFGRFGEMPCYCARRESKTVPAPFETVNLRAFFLRADDAFRQMAGYARQVVDLHLNFRFCGRCGSPTRPLAGEHARICPDCTLTAYPRISPAVIMAVTRGERILLARGINFPNKEMFSVLAGFVSPSETLEACVAREVFEETGVRVSDVRYVHSQPWPFPDSLMIGFTAQYLEGGIEIDPTEIVEADWFHYRELPVIPDAYTLAGRLIRDFARKQERACG